MIVTTSYRPSGTVVNKAKEWAAEWGIRFVSRQKLPVIRLYEEFGVDTVCVFGDNEFKIYRLHARALEYHPSLAMIRVKRLVSGETDPLLQVSEVRVGDRVLDCTAGLGADAAVYSWAVGDSGRVTAVDSEPIPIMLLSGGVSIHSTGFAPLDKALSRIETVLDDHYCLMQHLPDNSYDIVYFDPMFRQAVDSSSAISSIREITNPHPLRTEAVKEACRIASRMVVLKDAFRSPEFERLGFTKISRPNATFTYGYIRCDS